MSVMRERSLRHDAAIGVRRLANDSIAERAAAFHDAPDALVEFVCECGDLACQDAVTLTLAEYRATTPGSLVGHD